MAIFEAEGLRRFEDEMVEHSKRFAPELCRVLGDIPLRTALRQAMDRAVGYGFTNRGPMRLYIEMMFLFGSDFDRDPLVPYIGELLRDRAEQMQRAERIYNVVLDYRAKVTGPDNRHVHRAVESLVRLARSSLDFAEDTFVADMLSLSRRTFPQWVEYIGESSVAEAIHDARAKAMALAFTTLRAQAMIVSLTFAFGKGCLSDPLYPWIANSLKQDDVALDPTARADRLERRALIWLDRVIEGNLARSDE